MDNASIFYEKAIQLSFGCMTTLDENGCILRFDSHIRDISEEAGQAFAGRRLTDVFVPVDKSGGEPLQFQTGPLPEAPERMLTQYRDSLYIDWKLTPLESGGSEGPVVLGAGIDVTKHIHLKQQLHHAERLATVGQLAAGIAHEINGPLNNILGYAQLSVKQPDLPEQVYQDLDNIIRMSLHAREVVKKVMLFSRQVPPKHDLVCLNDVIRESLYFTEPLCGKNGIEVICRLDETLPSLKGDFAQLRQVVVNLMVNAAQAMPEGGGQITITTGITGEGGPVMTIEDTGTGMTRETLSQCFDPFFTTKDVEEGTGLGLSVVHGIIKAHDGDIDVTSTTGEGSCFTLSFPAAPGKGGGDDG